jgi:hypothetical protein
LLAEPAVVLFELGLLELLPVCAETGIKTRPEDKMNADKPFPRVCFTDASFKEILMGRYVLLFLLLN